MTTEAVSPQSDAVVKAGRALTNFWWAWLVSGVLWLVASLVVLQFDEASVKTVGIIVGILFMLSGVQQIVIGALVDRWRWLWAMFGLLFIAAGAVCFANPENTFAGLADILGFLLLMVGISWTIRAFIERDDNPIWWLGLISGFVMIVLAFWTSGQFFIEKAYLLLVFAGIWAMLHGIGDIGKAFMLRHLRDELG
jgi:uncharacterized membrane protein HdeD (DUF308 family)